MADILTPTPGDFPDKYLVELGRLTAWWAMVEDALEGACRISHQALGAKNLMPREGLPRSLDKKLTYIKTSAKGLPRLKAQKAQILQLLRDTHSLKNERHRLTKSITFPGDGDPNVVKLLRWRHAPNGSATEYTTSSVQEVAALSAKVRALAIGWLRVALALCYEAHPKFFDEPIREAPRKLRRFFPIGKRLTNPADQLLSLVKRWFTKPHRPVTPR